MSISLYNSLSRKMEIFVPINPDAVKMYACGPTVYDFAHIGNARPAITFDILYRLLRYTYGSGHVVYVRNLTDVDDKIIARSQRDKLSIKNLTEMTAQAYQEDTKGLGCLQPTMQPCATDYIAEMIDMICRLVTKEHAYVADGHVLFDVTSYPEYGQLSGRNLDQMMAGIRIEVADYKRHNLDFVLWKPSAENEPGWESPFGRGRPGWHIECSAMIEACLHGSIDIHAGGLDLLFPHHENEIAQSCCARGDTTLASTWLHNGFVTVDGQKMSKSAGNFLTIRALREAHAGRALRLQMLMTHYRQPLDWQQSRTEECSLIIKKWFRAIEGHDTAIDCELVSALEDDLNTPAAITILHRRARLQEWSYLRFGLELLGFMDADVDALQTNDRPSKELVEDIIKQRNTARKNKDFAAADSLRDQLTKMGVTIKDGPDGTNWEYN